MDEGEPSHDPEKRGDDPEGAPAWVILPAIAGVIENEEKHLVPGTDLALQFADGTTILAVALRILPNFGCPYVIAALPSGRFLLYNGIYYICDAHTRVATQLPPSLEKPIFPRRSVGFIEDPRRGGHYLVSQLHPPSTTRHMTIVYYSTSRGNWDVKELASCPQHQLWGCNGGVLAYDGKLWWADLPCGFLTCDPFADEVHLRYVALPEGCVMTGADNIPSRENLDKNRFAKVSEGKLRYVQIHGLQDEPAVSLWSILDPEGPAWQLEYEVRWEEIWGDDSYKEADLTPGKVPAIALIDPRNHGVLYFLQGGMLFAVDMRATTRRIVRCEKFVIGNGLEACEKYHTSQFVHAWELPSTVLGLEHSSGTDSKYLNKILKSRIAQDTTVTTAAQAARQFFTSRLQAIRDSNTHRKQKKGQADRDKEMNGKALDKSSDDKDQLAQSKTSTVITAAKAAREYFSLQLQAMRSIAVSTEAEGSEVVPEDGGIKTEPEREDPQMEGSNTKE